jgi:2-dehydro-3-deoxyphosphogluconate aldolase/(4S)-4-hydroxy-2-oxoglutarate aldolase
MEDMLQRLRKSRVVAIIRGIEPEDAAPLFEALAAGGIRMAEVTLNTPQALRIIENMRAVYEGRMAVGAGTVLNGEMAHEAIAAGAQFLISPNADAGMIETAVSRGILPIPGVMTPTEIVSAVSAGAPVVKLFPSSSLGPSYVKELQGPLGHIPMIAVGGIHKDNAADYLRAGAVCIGIGGSLVSLPAIRRGDFAAITAYAEQLLKAIEAVQDQ